MGTTGKQEGETTLCDLLFSQKLPPSSSFHSAAKKDPAPQTPHLTYKHTRPASLRGPSSWPQTALALLLIHARGGCQGPNGESGAAGYSGRVCTYLCQKDTGSKSELCFSRETRGENISPGFLSHSLRGLNKTTKPSCKFVICPLVDKRYCVEPLLLMGQCPVLWALLSLHLFFFF